MLVKRNVLTIATGKPLYLELAINLARSFWYWNKDENIEFYLATDITTPLPDDIAGFVNIIYLKPAEMGIGFTPKLHLEKLAPPGQTLFIDSDCLIYGRLSEVFIKFGGHNVAVVGGYIESGDWFGDVTSVCKKLNLQKIPKFNGGVYYLENGEGALKVYQTARELEANYDKIGFKRLRNRPNDEVLMAAAMAIHGEKPIPDDGSIMAEFVNFQSGIHSALLKGKVTLYNSPGHKRFQKNWPLRIARPVIVHYLGHHNEIMPYLKEKMHLSYLLGKKLSHRRTKLYAFLFTSFPWYTKQSFKTLFRPLYRAVFGARAIKQSDRIVNDD